MFPKPSRGQGDDFILGAKTNLPTLGNEGDDWIEIGTQDGAPGDNFDLFNLDSVNGHDVMIGGGGFDEMLAEGGHDVMVGSEGEDHFDGGSGFDWTTYKNDTLGVTVDLLVNDFVEPPTTPSNAGILDRFSFVEGLVGFGTRRHPARRRSGGRRHSHRRGARQRARPGGHRSHRRPAGAARRRRNVLRHRQHHPRWRRQRHHRGSRWQRPDRRRCVAQRAHQRQRSRWPTITSVDSMADLVPYMLSGEINPSQLQIVREIVQTAGPSFDTAVFSGLRANYTISTAGNVTVVTDNRVVGPGVPITDGIDTLRGIERLQFADQAVVLAPGLNSEPVGVLTISDDTPAVNQLITVSNAGVTDGDGIAAAFVHLPLASGA